MKPPEAVVVPTQPVAIDTRVLHIVNGEHFSGAERVQSHLGRCLPKFGIQADFACLKPGKFASMVDENDGQWGIAYDASMNSRVDLRPVKQLRKLAREHDYQLFHAHTPRAAMITAVASTISGVPWIYHVHSPASRDSLSKITNQVNAWIEKQSLRGASHLITVSESLRLDCVVKGVTEDRVTVVHNGVPEIRPTRSTTPQPGGKWTIGMVALMRPRKGLEVLLDAIAKLKENETEVHLRCIGPFETEQYRQSIENQIERLGIANQIEMIGFTENVPEALSQLDAMVLPSVCGEGLPMVVLEAMAAALPVIATRVEGTPEAITHGVEGLVAEPSDPDSLAHEIAALVSGQHDWQAMAEAACDRHQRCFSDLAMSSGTADVYRNLLSASRQR
ncbi:MAG: glycosyltransferase family 4 protein [Rubripirellula sp.]|nr:glycosyltransferase family 4 protein [Rubripirellula sp.]